MNTTPAPGAPGIEPRWTSSAKDGIGTAYSTSSRVWFTLSHGILNEIYFPHVDSPNTRDMQFLISDGETFFHEEKRDLRHDCERPESDALLYRLTNSDPGGRYRIVKEIVGQPHSAVVLQRVRVEIIDPSLHGKLRLYALLAPHIHNTGWNNSAQILDTAGQQLLHAQRDHVHLVMGCSTNFTKRSVGYVGRSDGWTDLKDNLLMDWQYTTAKNGNVALTGEIDLSRGLEFTIGISLGYSCQSAGACLLQSFVEPFHVQRQKFIDQWKRTQSISATFSQDSSTAQLVRLSQQILLAHEDKTFAGATVASLSIPWGDTKDDSESGGYHLVWARDMVQTTTAVLACGDTDLPLRALVWLASVQSEDGGMPQNSRIDGTPYWHSCQLDEVASPVILAWRLANSGCCRERSSCALRVVDKLDTSAAGESADARYEAGAVDRTTALQEFDPTLLIERAMRYLITQGPITAQERWEENSGYSPSTLAHVIAAVACAADLAHARGDAMTANFFWEYADWLVASLESWTVTNCGELVPGLATHYVRITPAHPQPGAVSADPNTSQIQIANGGGVHPTRNVVDAGFLQLVRLGIKAADDPIIVDSIAVVDVVLKRELPQGPAWRRYNHDAYGQYPDGRAFDGSGQGRCWPLLTGERGHYEVAAGRDATPYIKAMEGFASSGGLLAEQLWDAPDLPQQSMYLGKPAGSAMPLCWAHAEYISLVRSVRDGVCFDRIDPIYQRYVVRKQSSRIEVWTLAHQPAQVAHGKKLRIICEAAGSVHWSFDGWAHRQEAVLQPVALGLCMVDLPIESLDPASVVVFTLDQQSANPAQPQQFQVEVVARARLPVSPT